jgi:hypothetical protein
MTYRIDCKKPEVSISSQFLKLSGLPASQPASRPNRVYKRILYLQKCAKNWFVKTLRSFTLEMDGTVFFSCMSSGF